MKGYGLYFAWVIALSGLLLSLYFGEVLKIEPCRLCWYQRIALFPLAILLGVATFRLDRNFISYALVLSIFGFIIAFYHWLETIFPNLRSAAICGYVHDCSETLFALFGVLTLPALSAIGFGLITLLLLLERREL